MSQIDNLNNGGGDVKVAGKKKFFKKSDILVFAICIFCEKIFSSVIVNGLLPFWMSSAGKQI